MARIDHSSVSPGRLIYPSFGAGGTIATLTVSTVDGWTLIQVEGDVEWWVSRGLRALLLTTPSDRVVVDLSAVDYLDHHGLATLARAHRFRRSRGGEVRLVAPPRSSLLLMRGAGAYELPTVYPTVQGAVA